jgi:hypothetical protein
MFENQAQSNQNNYIHKYLELLDNGRQKLLGTIENDVEDHLLSNPHYYNQMLELNRYVYTYYSTNSRDLTQSIEFIVLSDVLDKLIEKLNEHGYWYIAKKYNDNTCINIGENIDKTIPELRLVSYEQLPRYRLKSETNPDGWKIVSKKTEEVTIERRAKIHFLDSEMLHCLIKKYNENLFDDYFDNNYFDGIYNNLSVITIENPSMHSKDLYLNLIDIVRPLVGPILYE